jgi:hypothetical protein
MRRSTAACDAALNRRSAVRLSALGRLTPDEACSPRPRPRSGCGQLLGVKSKLPTLCSSSFVVRRLDCFVALETGAKIICSSSGRLLCWLCHRIAISKLLSKHHEKGLGCFRGRSRDTSARVRHWRHHFAPSVTENAIARSIGQWDERKHRDPGQHGIELNSNARF